LTRKVREGIWATGILSSLAATRRDRERKDKRLWQHGREVYRASHSARKKIITSSF